MACLKGRIAPGEESMLDPVKVSVGIRSVRSIGALNLRSMTAWCPSVAGKKVNGRRSCSEWLS